MKDLHDIFFRFSKHFPLPLILDGATGSELMRRGMPPGVCSERWIVSNPAQIDEVQRAYVSSGAQALYTPTFGANAAALKRHGETPNIELLNTSLCEQTKKQGVLTGGDMSPTGLFMEPYGESTFDDIVNIYAEQAKFLSDSGADFIVIETMLSLAEARAAVIGAKSVTNIPVFCTLTLDKNGHTMSGDTPTAAFFALADLGVAAFGLNCSTGPDLMLEALRPLIPYSLSAGIPLIAKPNAGMPHEDGNGNRHFDMDAHQFADIIGQAFESGIPVLGGCCGTNADYINAVREKIGKCNFSPVCDELPDISSIASSNCDFAVFDTEASEPQPVDDGFPDDIDEDGDYLCLRVDNMEAAEIFCEEAYSISCPIAMTGDSAALEYCRLRYNGKLLLF